MAIIFELVVNFGLNEESVARAEAEVDLTPGVVLRGERLVIAPPFVRRLSGGGVDYIEFSVHPRGVGFGGPGPKSFFDPRTVTDAELTEVGQELYNLLRRFDGYEAAMVGWDPEGLVDLAELEAERVVGGSIASLNGLVVSRSVADRWESDAGWVPFQAGYVWLPYSGSRNPFVC